MEMYRKTLEILKDLLQKSDNGHWAQWLDRDIVEWDSSKSTTHHRSAFGGMGSINDLWVGGNGKIGTWNNNLFDLLKSISLTFATKKKIQFPTSTIGIIEGTICRNCSYSEISENGIFVALKGDTVEFAYLGYKKGQFIIPDTLNDERYSLIQVLVKDTLTLAETVIFPWPTKEEFKRAFMELKVPDNDLARAERNLELAQLKEVKDAVAYDGSINYKYAMQQQQSRLYGAGQYPRSNLFNPLAWAQFIKAWQDGAFKKKD